MPNALNNANRIHIALAAIAALLMIIASPVNVRAEFRAASPNTADAQTAPRPVPVPATNPAPAPAPAQEPITTGTTPAATQAAQQPTAAPEPPPSQPKAVSPATATPAAQTDPAATPQTPPPPPQKLISPEVTQTISSVVESMEAAEKSLRDIKNITADLGELRDKIDNVISKTTKTADQLRPKLADINSQIQKLGPAPAKDAPPEAPAAATERTRLDAQATELSSAIKTLEVTWWRARQAIDKITELRLRLFVHSLTQRMSSPIFPSFWSRTIADWPSVSWRLNYNVNDWMNSAGKRLPSLSMIAAAGILIYLLLKGLAFRLTRFQPPSPTLRLSFFESAASAAWVAPIRALPGILVALGTYAAFDQIGLLYQPTAGPVGISLLRSVLIYIAVASLLNAVFAPHEPARRLMPLTTRSARRVARLLKLLAAIYTADLFFSDVSQILYFPLSVSIVQALVTSVAFAGVMIGLLLTPFARDDVPGPTRRDTPRWIKTPLWLAVVAIVSTALIGYVALSRFISQQIMMTGVIALVSTLLYLAIRAFTRQGANGRNAASIFMEQRLGFDASRRSQIAWLIETMLTVTLILVAVPLIMLQWGFAAVDIRDWVKQLLFGFEIGQLRISLVRIVIGIAIFIALLFATRILQRRLRETVLNQPKMDPGIANSIDTTIGYAGIIIAAIIAVSYAGFDITNLAIVAGALSVGIGFGLQSIVNNFISGLILLIERPIKVGDWIVIGNDEGTVRKISVRSTEIETFDRASLIVPNSELITGRVLNWTHRNALGRVFMQFSAGPDVDPKTVLEVLTECADNHPDVLREPKPLVIFEGYTPTATEYSLRVHLSDITRGLRVRSDLRVAIFEALHQRGIKPPQLQLKVQATKDTEAG